MASPIRPSDIKDTLPTTDGSACARLKKVIVDFPRRVYDWFSYIYNEDGTFTEAFKADFCEIKCDDVEENDPVNPEVTNPGGNLTVPDIKAGAAMRVNGGIPIVFDAVDGATKYDIYRGTTNSITANTTVRLRKDLKPILRNMNASRSTLCKRKDNTILYVDVNGGPVYNSTTRKDDPNSNSVNGQTIYYYWVVAKGRTGAKSDYAGPVIGSSRYVPNFAAIGTPKMLWSSQAETPTGLNLKTQMRVVLRAGGGGGGGGGDYTLATFNKFHLTNINYSSSTGAITFTFDQSGGVAHSFKVGEQLALNGSLDVENASTWDAQSFEVKEILTNTQGSNQITCSAISNLVAPKASATLLPGSSSAYSWGVIHAVADELPTRIPGGGGGAGGILLAVFDITAITDVRVRTYGSNYVSTPSTGTQVAYTNNSNSDLFGSGHQGDFYPLNLGGAGRADTSTGPKAGEPKVGTVDGNTANVGPYKTVLEVKKGSTWYRVAWVSDGEGGGHADVIMSHMQSRSSEGLGSPQVYWDSSSNDFAVDGSGSATLQRYGTKSYSGICAIRGTALGNKGKVFYMGADGQAGLGAVFARTSGTPGVGGHSWDSLEPKAGGNAAVKQDNKSRNANALDVNAPGSGAFGAYGEPSELLGANAYGGHALAGGAYITFSPTTSGGTEGYDTA